MPAGGERPGAWAPGPAFGHLTDRGMKPYSPWPQRQEEGRTVLGRSRTLLLDCCVGLPGGRDEVGCTGLGVRRDVLCGERVSPERLLPPGATSQHRELEGCSAGSGGGPPPCWARTFLKWRVGSGCAGLGRLSAAVRTVL